jgi:dynein heavy chain 1
LKIKRNELEEKKHAANAKLQQMMENQQKAETEKILSEKLRGEMAQNLTKIETRKNTVSEKLAKVIYFYLF